jgi:hypothetical protein
LCDVGEEEKLIPKEDPTLAEEVKKVKKVKKDIEEEKIIPKDWAGQVEEEEEESKPKEDHPVVDTEVKQTWSEEKWQAWRAAWLEAEPADTWSTCGTPLKWP